MLPSKGGPVVTGGTLSGECYQMKVVVWSLHGSTLSGGRAMDVTR